MGNECSTDRAEHCCACDSEGIAASSLICYDSGFRSNDSNSESLQTRLLRWEGEMVEAIEEGIEEAGEDAIHALEDVTGLDIDGDGEAVRARER